MLQIEPPSAARAEVPSTFALWAFGFRPFYFVAAVFAALSVLLWALSYTGIIPPTYLRDPVWHGHEMLFGYTIAVVAGFLFTAVRNWTGKPTPTGPLLAALVALWIAGRVLVLTPYPIVAGIVNAAFPIAVAIAIAVPLAQSGNRRNYFFVALLVLVGIAALALHLSYQGLVAWPARASLQVGLDIVLFIMAVMGGRVIPMFTNNGVPGTKATRKPWLEKIALGSVLVLLAADLVDAPTYAVAAIALIAAVAHGARLALWQSWRTLGTPIVWILHAAYAWIVVYLLLRSLAAIGLVSPPLTVHALTIGAIGGLTIGMITRTARGHTGRLLVADRFEVACYVLVQLAAIVRLFGGLLLPGIYVSTVVVSALCWSAAFAIYAVRYWPVLSRSRIDGKPG